ncbi:MAG TPA: MerR family transcriptional regulator [Planctomycetota bacterium]|nr:MerR family transcriptional regulator [Planctomycetota bacterium]
MFTIGEFSKITSLSVKTLRFYHEKGLLVPAAVDPASGYRLYDERNIDQARLIVALRGLGFTLEEIAGILAACSEDKDLLAQLERQRDLLSARIKRLGGALEQVNQIISREREARAEADKAARANSIEERELPALLVAGVRMTGCYSDCGKGFALLGRRLGRNIAGTPFCLYYDCEFREDDAQFEACMPVRSEVQIEGINVRQLSGGLHLTLLHRGPYEELGRSYARLLRHAKARSYCAKIPAREVYHKGPGMIFRGNPKNYLTEIQVPVGAL